MPTGVYKRTEYHNEINRIAHKGQVFTKAHRKKLSDAKKGKRPKNIESWIGENHPQWKGDAIGYRMIHQWLQEKFGKATKCENKKCSRKSQNFQWALIKGKKYSRKRDIFFQLCASCHKNHDNKNRRSNETERS